MYNVKCRIEKSGQKGFIALTSVLVISAVVLSIALTVTYLSIGQGQSGLALSKGEEQLNFAEGCMEDALLKIRADASYSGGSITRQEGTCSVTVSKAGSVYTITTTGEAVAGYQRSVQTVATRGSSITISSWKEI